MMYTVYDFVNNDIKAKHMRFGWKIEVINKFPFQSKLVLKYTMLNFDWKSLDHIGNDLWNMFLDSISYKRMKAKNERAKLKLGRMYYEAYSINELKALIETDSLKIDVDKLIAKLVSKKSEKIQKKIAEKAYD